MSNGEITHDVGTIKVMRLRYAGVCACGAEVAKGERAAYDRGAKSIWCLACHASTAESPDPRLEAIPRPNAVFEAPTVLDVGIAGAGAVREYERRKAKDDAARAQRSGLWRALNGFFYPDGRQTTNAWKVGAAGEERVAGALTMLVEAGAGYALHDRRVPGKLSNIDHIFIGPTGVFVIDAKNYRNAEVTVERTGGLFAPVTETLKVGSRRKGGIVQGIQKQCNVVATALTSSGHRDIRVVPILCFVEASLPWRAKNRRVGDVRLSGPQGLAELVAADGPLDDEQRLAIARALSQALPSMT